MSQASPSQMSWQDALSNIVTDPNELMQLLQLKALPWSVDAVQAFPLRVPRSYIARMEKANPSDPLLLQVLPQAVEMNDMIGYQNDPLQEISANPVPGLLHKYPNRVLVTLTGTCAIHCRYCFRRHFPYKENNPGKQGWTKIFDYIAANENINEVILSGGDPLAVNDKLLTAFSEGLSTLPHLKRLRIHTRLPVVLPERITDELIAWIDDTKLAVIIVIHANHPREFNAAVTAGLQKLRKHCAYVLNQSVLLKGVNDNPTVLADLSEALFLAGVVPYYLHVLDKVAGAAHFDIPLENAKRIYATLAEKLPGYLLPKLVVEEPQQLSKSLVPIS